MKRMTVDERMKIVGMLRRGMTGYEIAYETGRSEATIGKVRRELQREGFDVWHRPGVMSRYIK